MITFLNNFIFVSTYYFEHSASWQQGFDFPLENYLFPILSLYCSHPKLSDRHLGWFWPISELTFFGYNVQQYDVTQCGSVRMKPSIFMPTAKKKEVISALMKFYFE
jgi:hypothetical protein